MVGGSPSIDDVTKLDALTTYDPVHCVGVNDDNNFKILETPRYLSANTGGYGPPEDARFPDGLTQDALQAWCAAGTDCNYPWEARFRYCINPTFSTATCNKAWLGASCMLRCAPDQQYEEKDEGGGQTDSGLKVVGKFAPACGQWADGLDPDEWCQSNTGFTGCVITETARHQSSLFSGNTQIEGYTLSAAGDSQSVDTAAECQRSCTTTTLCTVWLWNDTCTFFRDPSLWQNLEVGTPDDVVGIVGPGSGGFVVPNQHFGPTNEIYLPRVGRVFALTAVWFFVNDPAFVPTSLSSNYTFDGEIVYLGAEDETSTTVELLTAHANQTVQQVAPADVLLAFPNFGTRPPPVVRVTFLEEIYVLGSPLDPRFDSGSRTAPQNYRITFRGTDGEPPMLSAEHPLIPALYIPGNGSHAVTTPASAQRNCVPLTYRTVVTRDTLSALAGEYTVRRTDPINCAVMASDTNNVNNNVFKDGGCCASDQQLEWPDGTPTPPPTVDLSAECAARTDAGLVSNMRLYSNWFSVLSDQSADGRVLMMDASNPATTTVGTLDLSTLVAQNPSWIVQPTLGSLPTCTSASTVDECTIAIDTTGYVPCTGTQTATWFECMNPMMEALFPQYYEETPSIPTTPFSRPMGLFTTYPTIADFLESGGCKTTADCPEFRWTQYATMTHYCQTFDTTGPSQPSGWNPNGRFLKCTGDPRTPAQRLSMCRDKQPWNVLTGNVLVNLELGDLCPFIDTPVTSDRPYCVVFADHPQYPTIRSMLGARLPRGMTWDNVQFFYAPYTLYAMRFILMSPSVINTLFTNSVDAGVDVESPLAGLPVLLTTSNKDDYGETIGFFAREILRDGFDSTLLDPICNDEPIPLSAFRAM